MDNFEIFDYDVYARSIDEFDFWGQVKRSINGKSVDQLQIDKIVRKIQETLKLDTTDIVLDIACGNGALGYQLRSFLGEYIGVDLSPYLIQVAKSNFQISNPRYSFYLDDASSFVRNYSDPGKVTKSLCYGSFSYLNEHHAQGVLENLLIKFVNLDSILIGNLPDYELRHGFFGINLPNDKYFFDHQTQFGRWFTVDSFTDLANETGWQVTITRMPEDYYASRYRFDALLTRKN